MAVPPLSMVYHSENNCPLMFEHLKNFYRLGEFCDIILSVGDIKIHAHRVILGAFSVYLYQKMKLAGSDSVGGHKFTNTTTIIVNDLDQNGLKILVDFCYSGVICVDSTNVKRVYSVARTLQIKEIEKLCETFLTAQRNFSTEISSIGTQHSTGEGGGSISRNPGYPEPGQIKIQCPLSPTSLKTDAEPEHPVMSTSDKDLQPQDLSKSSSLSEKSGTQSEFHRNPPAKRPTVIDLTKLPSPVRPTISPGQPAKSPIRNPVTPPKHLPISPIANQYGFLPSKPLIVSPLQHQLPSPIKYSMSLPLFPPSSPLPHRSSIFVDKTPSPQKSPGSIVPPLFPITSPSSQMLYPPLSPHPSPIRPTAILPGVDLPAGLDIQGAKKHSMSAEPLAKQSPVYTENVPFLKTPESESSEKNINNVFTCLTCSAIFYNPVEFRCHQLNHKPPPKAKSASSSRSRSTTPDMEEMESSSEKKEFMARRRGNYRQTVAFSEYKCAPCNKYFKDLQALKFHKYNHVLRHTCNVCGKKFSRGWNFLRHKKTHFTDQSGKSTENENDLDAKLKEEEDQRDEYGYDEGEEEELDEFEGEDDMIDIDDPEHNMKIEITEERKPNNLDQTH